LKRKVIQIANSTQLVSLPRAWAKRNNIQKGQEVDVLEDGKRVLITADTEGGIIEKAEIDATDMDAMIPRMVHAMYKRGVDELKITFNNPDTLNTVQESLGKEVVGFELLEQGSNYCVIKNVSGNIVEFDSVLRRAFLLLLTMSDQCLESIRKSDYANLKSVAFLEEANNRFSTMCRRALNKNGSEKYNKVGPIYYIVEELEKIADQYKYVCLHYQGLNGKKEKLNKTALETFSMANKMLREFYELFYKFDKHKIASLKATRNKIIDDAHSLFKKKLNHTDYWLVHHSITIANKVFCLLGPYLVLST